MQTLFESPKYKSFIQDRDRALEKINLNMQTDLSRILDNLLLQVEKEISYLLFLLGIEEPTTIAHLFDKGSLDLFNEYVPQFVNRIKKMRRAVYVISYLGEQEAIGRATKRKKQQSASDFIRKLSISQNKVTLLDTELDTRIWVSVMKLRSRILDRFRSSLITEDTPKEVLSRIKDVFPKKVQYKRPPRELKPIREADNDPKDKLEYNYDFAPQEDWDLAVQAYKETDLPPNRFDNVESFDPDSGIMKYDWEVEQDATDDFVDQVRTGQVDAAKDLGIEDFVWVAIIDNKTDDCCLDRNGKTTSEIKKMLESGDLDADDCDATSPPAHTNCRCQSDPVASTDEVEGPDWKSFNEWLQT